MKEGSCTYLLDIWAWYCGFSLGVIVISTFTFHLAKFDVVCAEGMSCNTLQYVDEHVISFSILKAFTCMIQRLCSTYLHLHVSFPYLLNGFW
jgi:hypothetical protein